MKTQIDVLETTYATKAKLEEEVKSENLEVSHVNETEMSDFSSTSTEETDHQKENVESAINLIEENIENEINNSTSNGLENFQIDDEDTPELFNSDNSEHSEDTFSSEKQVKIIKMKMISKFPHF